MSFARYAVPTTALGLALAGAVFLTPGAGEEAYHESQFFNYRGFIETSVREAVASELPIEALGGIVPHHIPTTIPLLAEFYLTLKGDRSVKTFVVIGPDHIDAGRGDVSVSRRSFAMPLGTLKSESKVIDRLVDAGLALEHETPFDREHSIDSQLLLISAIFPEATIVPIIVRSSMTNSDARAFGRSLAELLPEDVFVVASVDFSHYLTEEQARPIDQLSSEVLQGLDSRATPLVEADSEQSLVAFISYLEARGAKKSVSLGVLNTQDFNGNNDYTTGYVAGFFGY